MSKYSYEIKSSFDFFRKLLDEREDFLRHPTSSRFAINCALTSWHLVEWVYHEYKASATDTKSQAKQRKQQFRQEVIKQCRELKTMRDLADGSKHFMIDQRTPIVEDTIIVTGALGRSIKDPGNPYFVIQVNDNDFRYRMTFDDTLYSVTFFWYLYFRNDLKTKVDELMKCYEPF